MKTAIHPKWFKEAKVTCACGNTFTVGATTEEVRVDVCSKCHPFYTGQMKFLDTAGRVEKFKTKMTGKSTKNVSKADKRKLKREELRYISDDRDGFLRQKVGRQFRYYDTDLKRIKDKKILDEISGQAVVVKKAKPVMIECVVRGYILGSGYKDYQKTGSVCGIKLPAGLKMAEKLPEPIFTPSTKAEIGTHDENISFEKACSIVGKDLATRVRDISLKIYTAAAKHAEARGIIPTNAWKQSVFGQDVFPGEAYHAGIGQGYDAATPLQLLNAYSALANGGKLYEPRLVERITDHEGEEIFHHAPAVIRQAIPPGISGRVKRILRNVVEKGTGKNAAVPGYSIAGKTGTSKKIDPRTGKYLTGKNVASFAGFFPVPEPQYTILVVLDNPKGLTYGGETAAPAFQEIAKKIITLKGIKPDAPIPHKSAPQTARISD